MQAGENNYKALLNEYKGSLFEYLVGLEFAKNLHLESQYLQECYQTYGHVLEQQESFIRNYYPHLLELLPSWSAQVVRSFQNEHPLKTIKKVRMVGKQLATVSEGSLGEADILLIGADKTTPLSLKLAKGHSYVNTKSTGIKNLFKKYFKGVCGESIQKDFNTYYDFEFEEFAMKMHVEAGLIYEQGFKVWEKEGLPTLPGQLESEFRTLLLDFYFKVNQRIFSELKRIYQNNPRGFIECLWPLLGFSHPDLIQVLAYHKEQTKAADSCEVFIKQRSHELVLKEYILKEHSIEFVFQNYILQLRLKPMNKFSASAYKINCSVKLL